MRSPLPRHRKVLYSILPAALLLALLAGAEAALRVFAQSLDRPFVTVARYSGIDWYQVNRRYLAKYFAPDVVLLPEFKPEIFRKTKTPEVFRVFCLGESSMFGTPYTMNATIPAMLRLELRRLMPRREVEVINLGAAAINSNVIADLATLLPAFSPDLVVVYAGHNEFYGPDGVGVSFFERYLPFLTPLKYRLRDFRLVRLLWGLFERDPGKDGSGDASNLMRIASRGALVSLESEEATRVFRMFERNLTAMVSLFRDSGIPLIVADVSSNLMFPPFAPGPPAGLEEIPGRIASGECGQEILSRLRNASSALPGNAFVHYWLGRCLLAQGDTAQAKERLQLARDEDMLKFRAPTRSVNIIHRVCLSEGTPLVQVDSAFAALSPGGIPGENLFWEHLHPKASGYYEIASLFLHSMRDLHLIPGFPVGQGAIPFNTDSLVIPWLELAYADLAMQHLTSQWPFEGYRVSPAVLKGAADDLPRLAGEVYERRIDWDEGCYSSVALLMERGRFPEAETTCRALIEENPFSARAQYVLGNVDKAEGRPAPAAGAYLRSIELDSASPYPRIDLALLWINENRLDEAEGQLRAAVTLAPSTPGGSADAVRASALYGLSAVAANRGRFAEALGLADESLRLVPSYAPALRLRDRLREVLRR